MSDSDVKRVAIMQPYFLPYIGYFQLICASDVFVFYDDVNFMKKSWLRRNRIWANNQELLISLPCKGASRNKLINEVQVDVDHPTFQKIQKSIRQAYSNTDYFETIEPLLEQIFSLNRCSVAEFNIHSIELILNYLGIEKQVVISSEVSPETCGMQRAERLIEITKLFGGTNYVNSPGGKTLYSKDIFRHHGIELEFINPAIPIHDSGDRKGMPLELSILDALFNFGKKKIVKLLCNETRLEN